MGSQVLFLGNEGITETKKSLCGQSLPESL
jgi:hypothetical protein